MSDLEVNGKSAQRVIVVNGTEEGKTNTGAVTGLNDLSSDAWGRQKVVIDKSLFHGICTQGIPEDLWIKKLNGVEVIDGSLDTNIRDENGAAIIKSTTLGQRYTLMGKRHPRYQPNRGHLFSDSSFIIGAGSGTLYSCKRTTFDGVTTDYTRIAVASVSREFGHVNDIQFQWRGVGNYKWFVDLDKILTEEILGTLNRLSIANPALPAFYEAVKGSHTVGGVLRNNSCVRWGLGTELNGVFYEFEYEDDRDARIEMGCCDISSEGGDNESLTYGSATSGDVTIADTIDSVVLAIRVPLTRTINTSTGTFEDYNTRDLILKAINTGQNDEQTLKVFYTRDPTAIDAGVAWTRNWSDDVEFVNYNDVVSFDSNKAVEIFSTRVETDLPYLKDTNKILTNGDYLIVVMNPVGPGGDIVTSTIEFEAEK